METNSSLSPKNKHAARMAPPAAMQTAIHTRDAGAAANSTGRRSPGVVVAAGAMNAGTLRPTGTGVKSLVVRAA